MSRQLQILQQRVDIGVDQWLSLKSQTDSLTQRHSLPTLRNVHKDLAERQTHLLHIRQFVHYFYDLR